MTYSTAFLSIPPDEAAALVAQRVSGVRRTTDGDRITFTTNSGATVAVISPAPRGEPHAEAQLRYRVALVSPMLAHARSKGRAVRDVLDDYRV